MMLSRHPLIGTRRTTADPSLAGIRSIGVNRFRNYLVFFIPGPQKVHIIRVVHGARDIERLLNP